MYQPARHQPVGRLPRGEAQFDSAQMAVQSPAEARARFFDSGHDVTITRPQVPAACFLDEAEAALLSGDTGFFVCDQSGAIGCSFAATTPLMLARYAAIAPHARLTADFIATGAIWYVIRGTGTAEIGDERIAFSPRDIFVLPGGAPATLTAFDGGAVLWVVTNEPQLALDGLRPAPFGTGPIEIVRYGVAEIATHLTKLVEAPDGETTAGATLILSNARQEERRHIMPSLTLSLNTLPPGGQQRCHRRNSAAVTLVLRGDDCHSMVGGKRCAWMPFATLVTPAGETHSHYNASDRRAMALIVQDSGLHDHARTMDIVSLD